MVLVVAVSLHGTGVFSLSDEAILDHASLTTAPPPSDRIAIVEITNETYAQFGSPLPRRLHALLMEQLARGGAERVVFDLVFDLPAPNPKDDSSFARALRAFPRATLAGELPELERRIGRAAMKVRDAEITVRPLEAFLPSGIAWGVVQAKSDAAGLVRRYRSVWPDPEGNPHLALGTRALVDAGWIDPGDLQRPSHLTDPRGFRIRWLGPSRSFAYHTFETVIDGPGLQTPEEKAWGESLDLGDSLIASGVFKGRIVLVGTTDFLDQDIIKTPFDPSMPGVEMHAHAMATVLGDLALRDLHPLTLWPAWIAAALLVPGLARRSRHWWIVPVSATGLAALWVGAAWGLAAWGGMAMPPSTGVVVSLLSALSASLEKWVEESKRKRQITAMFGQYVPPGVVRMMIENPERVQLGGARGEVTVMFSDLKGFTALSERLPPEQLVAQLGECMTVLSQCILDEGGTLDKYMGDAILAEFGIPLPLPGKVDRACRAAWAMQRELGILRDKWEAQGLPGLRMRVGISTGMALYGNMGSRQLFDYTVLGDVVNIGSRLEGANKHYGTWILLDGGTRLQLGPGITTRMLDRTRLSGKAIAVEVHELVGIGDELILSARGLEIWEAIRQAHDRLDLIRLEKLLGEFGRIHPYDGPAAVLMGRLEEWKHVGPPSDWNGEVELLGK